MLLQHRIIVYARAVSKCEQGIQRRSYSVQSKAYAYPQQETQQGQNTKGRTSTHHLSLDMDFSTELVRAL